jgi:hypothetical protein
MEHKVKQGLKALLAKTELSGLQERSAPKVLWDLQVDQAYRVQQVRKARRARKVQLDRRAQTRRQ